ncbi:DUF4176 domain-containing protein [Macrococcus capreoli]|uniref:DUF4176 domain-containing protein n=1 Tax=Macrococcus capreoli TaxID=2982690 RepID=UPI0021D5CCC1|nr:DUF4176 domain-containing protein [Macrococcus sp. TMW 2.2395]MCU7557811.1 DUF4176 domain-containing protein [Macrococcus sp. TMW 2.2395]
MKEGTQKLMILNRGYIEQSKNQNLLFDYSACRYPMGFDFDEIYYFNEENIDKVIFNGFEDEEELRYRELYQVAINDPGLNYRKGIVENSHKIVSEETE